MPCWALAVLLPVALPMQCCSSAAAALLSGWSFPGLRFASFLSLEEPPQLPQRGLCPAAWALRVLSPLAVQEPSGSCLPGAQCVWAAFCSLPALVQRGTLWCLCLVLARGEAEQPGVQRGRSSGSALGKGNAPLPPAGPAGVAVAGSSGLAVEKAELAEAELGSPTEGLFFHLFCLCLPGRTI